MSNEAVRELYNVLLRIGQETWQTTQCTLTSHTVACHLS